MEYACHVSDFLCPFKTAASLLLVMVMAQTVGAQTIHKAEYFFDTDPGKGNGTALTIPFPSDPVTFTASISTAGLLPGHHVLFVRTRTSDYHWSLYEPKPFFIQQSIVKAEYFFDTDPGRGLAVPIPVFLPFFDSGTLTASISTTGLSPGYHFLFIRTRDESGHWSLYQPKEFFIRQSIVAAEYFFDTDPGVRLGIPIPVVPTLDQVTLTPSISAAALTPGSHLLFVRTKNESGRWSLHQPLEFFIRIPVMRAEFFVDTDPGNGNGTPFTIPVPSDLVTVNPTLTTGVLPDGTHYLFIRTRDIFGKWSLYEPQAFTVDSALPIELLEFSASAFDDYSVRVHWTTVTEHHSDYFAVQHSPDGMEFTEIARVKAAGNSMSSQHYTIIHSFPLPGKNYYRLKQVDDDGQSTLSKIVTVQMNGKVSTVVYPNPVVDQWFVDFTREDTDQERWMELFDLTGRKCEERKADRRALVKFSRQGLSAGTYVLRITSADGSVTVRKLVFQ